LQAERVLREKHNGVRFRNARPHRRVPAEIYARPYLTLPDVEFPVHVWLIDGNLVRSWYKTDYTEGGHGYVYRRVPKDQIWIEKDLYVAEMPFIVVHEYLELRLMRDRGIAYDRAHAICSKVEFDVRKGRGIKPLLAPGPRRLKKPDLHRLTRDDVFRYVTAHYLDR